MKTKMPIFTNGNPPVLSSSTCVFRLLAPFLKVLSYNYFNYLKVYQSLRYFSRCLRSLQSIFLLGAAFNHINLGEVCCKLL